MTQINTITILGGGLIGGSWAALFLSRGLQVRMADPAPHAADQAAAGISAAWPHLAALSSIPATPPWQAFTTTPDIATACQDADFVQECGPDRLPVKHDILAQAETALRPDTPIASSTSSLMATEIAQHARHPERVLVAHPMNPPHLVPLVELVPGQHTNAATIKTAHAFYETLDRVPIVVKKERRGHLANRLTSALYREAVHIVAEGIATVEDVDRAIANGPGLRWALMGPHLIYHLGGGTGGYRAYLDHLGPTQQARWAELGNPELTPETMEKLVQGLEQELQNMDATRLIAARDDALVALAKLKKKAGL